MKPIQRGVVLAACSWALWAPAGTVLAATPEAPVARTEAKALVEHGHTRTDEYYWLRERDNPEVIRSLEAENAYTDAVMGPTEALRKTLFDEIVGRIKPDDAARLAGRLQRRACENPGTTGYVQDMRPDFDGGLAHHLAGPGRKQCGYEHGFIPPTRLKFFQCRFGRHARHSTSS